MRSSFQENWRSSCFVQLLKRMNQKADEIQAGMLVSIDFI